MIALRPLLLLTFGALPSLCATFGTPVQHPSPLVDLALDNARKRLYVLNPLTTATGTGASVEVYDVTAKVPTLLPRTGTIAVDPGAVALAISRPAANGQPRYLYVACYTAGVIDKIDLNTLTKVDTITLPANPEAVAVGFDDKVLISTTGSPQGQFILMTYDPNAPSASALQSISIAPPAPATITQIAPTGTAPHLVVRAHLVATPDGQTIIGVHEPSNNTRTVFVYQVSSATMLRSRTITLSTPILAVSPTGDRFVSGHLLFDSATLAVLAQQNAVNSPFPFAANANFNSLATQGGAAFMPDGSQLLTVYNIPPVANPAAQTNIAQLLINTPDNLLIQLGIQLPQNLNGKIVVSSDGQNAYGLSTSGFIVLPLSTLKPGAVGAVPIVIPDSNVALLAADQCGILGGQNTATIPVRNITAGNVTLSAGVLTTTSTSATLRANAKSYGADITASMNANLARTTLGTAVPDSVLIQSAQAVNVIPTVRIFQNQRNSETPGTIIPVDIGATTTGLTDIVLDTARQRFYIANPGLNRIEVFDMATKQFVTPITSNIGQLPRSLALSNDGNSLYVANSSSEILSLVHLQTDPIRPKVDVIAFPPLPFTNALGIVTPQLVAATQRDPQVLMSSGALWKIVGNTVTPRSLNPNIFGAATTIAGAQSMVATPEGSYILILAAQGTTGTAYVYSAAADDVIAGRQVISPITGYFGSVAAGPNGQYYLAGPQLLDSALTLIGSTATSGVVVGPGLPGPGGPVISVGTSRPVAAVAAVGAQTFARFSTPLRTSLNTPATDAGLIEFVDAATQRTTASINVPEGPLTTALAAGRTNISSRMMAVDAATNTAYILTASGLSMVPVTAAAAAATPQLSAGGIVNTANYQGKVAMGGLVSVFGRNLAQSARAPGTPLPTLLGGTCVTLNNAPIPLLATSATQINAQIPPTLAAGNYQVVVRSTGSQAASNTLTVAVAKYAPAVFVDANGPAIFHQNGTRVDKSHHASRDEPLVIYATGLGPTTGGRVTAGSPSPSSPLAVTAALNIYFGDPTRDDTPVIVDWSGLAPGLIGVYQINCRIPGRHFKGDAIPVTLKIGGVSSPVTGANVPVVYVD